MVIILNLLLLMVNIDGSSGEVITTLGYQLTKNGREFQNNQGKKFSISESCKQIEIGNPDLNSKVDTNSYYFLVKLTCNDIVDDEEFFNQERDVGNSTIDKKGTFDLSPYQCTLNVTLDNSEHCCCPERKNGFQFKILN
ncbi:unnamed protein product [Paramecium octaurelia]|uniref:Uncharacterized protein n=1 Tax=Paramecium octaurelia TaxID=43137 RepID=A0A8S1WMC2_PAROT|nr:unnamed protein product [Paramecium octaurelia]